MKFKMPSTVLLIFLFVGFLSAETVFVSYQKRVTGEKFLLKMDAFGNVAQRFLLRGLHLGPLSTGGNVASALSHNNDSTLVFWTVGKTGVIYRALVRKNTGKVTKVFRTHLRTDNNLIPQVSQKPEGNFLFLQKDNEPNFSSSIFAIGLNSFNAVTNRMWDISIPGVTDYQLTCASCGGRMAADGKAAVILDLNNGVFRMHLQSLNQLGLTRGDPKLISAVSLNKQSFAGADISNVLSNNRRFILYQKEINVIGSQLRDKLFLQPIDSREGTRIGNPIQLAAGDNGDITGLQGLAIDPKGRFVIFETFEGLFFLGLDITGRPSSTPKLLARETLDSVDILLDK